MSASSVAGTVLDLGTWSVMWRRLSLRNYWLCFLRGGRGEFIYLSCLYLSGGKKSSSSNQSIVFRETQRSFQEAGFGRTAVNLPNLPSSLQPLFSSTTLLWVGRLRFSEKLYCQWCDLGKMPVFSFCPLSVSSGIDLKGLFQLLSYIG